MDNEKKLFRLDLSIAVEATSAQEAFDILVTDETLKQIRELVIKSKDNIKEMFEKEDRMRTCYIQACLAYVKIAFQSRLKEKMAFIA